MLQTKPPAEQFYQKTKTSEGYVVPDFKIQAKTQTGFYQTAIGRQVEPTPCANRDEPARLVQQNHKQFIITDFVKQAFGHHNNRTYEQSFARNPRQNDIWMQANTSPFAETARETKNIIRSELGKMQREVAQRRGVSLGAAWK